MKPAGLTLFAAWSASLALGCLASAQDAAQGTGRNGPSEASLAPGSAILAELNSGVDSKKAKAGDAITAHTLEALKSTDERLILPKGTRVEGHVTQSTARGKGGSESALGIQFDKAVLKDGAEISLNVIIQALAAPVSFGAPSDLGTPPTLGTTQTSPMSGSRTPPPTATPPAQASGGIDEAGAVSSPPVTAKSRGVIGLRGLTLNAAPANNRPATVVVSNGKSVHLDGGTRMLLVEQATGSEPSSP